MTESRIPRRALFLDRDGVINVDGGFLYRPEDCVLIDGAASLIRTANQLGYVTVVVSNQSGIGRGLFTEAEFHGFMGSIATRLGQQGAVLDAIYFSPYHPVHGIGTYKRESACRKPAPGMLLNAARDHELDLRRSFLVGDRCSDMLAGGSAGVPNLFLFGTTEAGVCSSPFPYQRVQTLLSVQRELAATS